MVEVKVEDREDTLEGHARILFNQAKSARDLIDVRMARSNDLYDSMFPADQKKISETLLGQFRLFIPKTYNTVQRMHTDIMGTFYFDPEELTDVVQRPDISDETRMATKALLNYRLNSHPINYFQESFEAFQDALKNKVGIFKVYPKFRTQKKKKKVEKQDEATGQIMEMMEEETVISDFEPQLECIPPEDLFVGPGFTWKDYWNYPMIHRYTKPKSKFKEMGFMNLDKAQEYVDLNAADPVKAQRMRSGGSPFYQPAEGSKRKLLCAFEFWDFMDLNDDGYLESVSYTMLGSATQPMYLALPPRKNTLPYRFSKMECVRPPIIIGYALPEAHKGYGKDVPEVTEALQNETNALRNQDREAAAIAIRKPILVNKDAMIDQQALNQRRIGAVIQGEDVSTDMVRELQLSSPIINTAQVSRQIDQDYYEATSLPPNQFGISTDEPTATGATRNDVNANKKINGIIRCIRYTLIQPAMQYLLRLEQAYESDEFIRMVTGKVLGWKLPNDGLPAWHLIQGDMELSVDTSLNKESQVNKYMLIMDRANQTNLSLGQLVMQGVVDPSKVKFLNPAWAFDQMLAALRVKNPDAAKIPALPPPPQDGEAKGVASQPRNNANPMVSVQPQNPEEAFLAEINGAS